MPWIVPNGILDHDMIEMLQVKLDEQKNVKTRLILAKRALSDSSCESSVLVDIFDIICSAIYHYESLAKVTRENLRDLIDCIYRYSHYIVCK